MEIEFRQTNAEFQLIDWIHEAGGRAAGIVINPAAFSHTSVAVLDALNTCAFPILEVHISNITNGKNSGVILSFRELPPA